MIHLHGQYLRRKIVGNNSTITKRGEFDNYLNSRFERANKGEMEKYFREFEINYSNFLPPDKGSLILDFGCGMGQFIKFLRKKGYTNVVGIEVGQEAVDYCEKNNIENIHKIDDLNEFMNNNANKFDLIILKSVIAHFKREDVISNLQLIRSALKEEGHIIVETFNMSVFTGIFALYDDYTHKLGFNEESLYQVLHESGFNGIKIYGNKYKVRGIKSLIWIILRKIWFFMLNVIYIIERGIGDNPKIFSKLLIAVAKK
jgi:2-polyprenyl-3-methyl-5-hydroxy-6-metoxy-1,4-benzoquinol methylase